jgi:hypothetical protein
MLRHTWEETKTCKMWMEWVTMNWNCDVFLVGKVKKGKFQVVL